MTDIMIHSMGARGDGLGAFDGARLAVAFALPGERVRLGEIESGRGTLASVLDASPDRAAPFCPHFGRCGGCSLQHWSKPAYQAWKRSLLIEALARVDIEAPVAALVDAHGTGRRRVTLHLRGVDGKATAGFMSARSHDLIDLDRCPVLDPALDGAADLARAFWPIVRRFLKPVDVQITATEAGLDVDLRGLGKIEEPSRRDLALLAQQLGLARLTLHGTLIIETRHPVLSIGKAKVTPPPGGFLQATQAGEAALATLVLAALPKTAKHVADLFCGIGPFALRMAERAKVSAIDSDAPAIDALQLALRHASGLKPVTASVRDLFRNPLSAKEMAAFDAVVFDPPRAGAEGQAKALAGSKVADVVAVSCNAQSFARDAAILVAGGYLLRSVTPVDQFAWSSHVEIVGHFSR
jgi:23S rRNA (uracil1939-C5)-methyltransferase